MSNKSLQPGDRLGNYILQEEAGKGAFAKVFKANHHERRSRVVALKIAVNRDFQRQLARECRVPDVHHPNVVPILDCDTKGDHPYVVMPYYPAGSLADVITRHPNGLPENRVEALLTDILSGLAAAHQQDIIHCDIKPANILLDDQGRALVADFGLSLFNGPPDALKSAMQTISRLRQNNDALAGTLADLAPEVLNGQSPTKAADLYALGIVLFEMLTGRRPAGFLEKPAQVRSHLRHADYFNSLFYRTCGPVEQRYPDAPTMLQCPWRQAQRPAIAGPRFWGWYPRIFRRSVLRAMPLFVGIVATVVKLIRKIVGTFVNKGYVRRAAFYLTSYLLVLMGGANLLPALWDWFRESGFFFWWVLIGVPAMLAMLINKTRFWHGFTGAWFVTAVLFIVGHWAVAPPPHILHWPLRANALVQAELERVRPRQAEQAVRESRHRLQATQTDDRKSGALPTNSTIHRTVVHLESGLWSGWTSPPFDDGDRLWRWRIMPRCHVRVKTAASRSWEDWPGRRGQRVYTRRPADQSFNFIGSQERTGE